MRLSEFAENHQGRFPEVARAFGSFRKTIGRPFSDSAENLRRARVMIPACGSKETLLAFLSGLFLGSASYGLAYWALTPRLITFPQDCPLEFWVSPLNTTSGWFYQVFSGDEPRLLSEYSITFFVYGPLDQSGNQQRRVDYSGPLADLVGATGDYSFEDRGSSLGKLDGAGDHFWAREWHNIEAYREGRIVGGTLACV